MTMYLRPETAQGIFANFRNVLTPRVKVPFGIAQIAARASATRTTKAFIFRTREFEQAEIEFFASGTDEEWVREVEGRSLHGTPTTGSRRENLRFRDHDLDELAQYAKACVDIEYRFPFGSGDWQELEGHRQPHRLRPAPAPAAACSTASWFENGRDRTKVKLADGWPRTIKRVRCRSL